MHPLVSAATMSAMDRSTMEDFGLPGRILMETAGREAARIFASLWPVEKNRILILCGSGNNGGDGWVAARYLLGWGADTQVILAGNPERLSPESRINRELYEKAGGETRILESPGDLSGLAPYIDKAAFFVDALFGIGLDREVQGLWADLIRKVNASPAPVFSLDIPSGIAADTGVILGEAIRAEHTVTFGLAKPGLFLEPGRSMRGQLHVVDIGIPAQVRRKFPLTLGLPTKSWASDCLPVRRPDSHKGHFGHILLAAGIPTARGAAVLAAMGALRAGAGLLTLAVPETSLPLPGIPPEAMVLTLPGDGQGFSEHAALALEKALPGKTLLAAGPGMGTGEASARILRLFLKTDLPLVLDADALTLLSLHPDLMASLDTRPASTVLTPHPGEMARLSGIPVSRIQQDRITIARNFSMLHHCHLLLKGAGTLAAEPGGFVRILTQGNPGMATGGSGDVLCGILAAFMAQGIPVDQASPLAAFVHGMAADLLASTRGPQGFFPSEVAAEIPAVLARLQKKYPSPPHRSQAFS
jgi:NAD(P)H-hydrate epimerase